MILLNQFDQLAARLAKLYSTGSAPAFGWLYQEFENLKRPRWSEDRDVHEFGICAERAMDRIGLDVMLLRPDQTTTPLITRKDLEKAFDSGWCQPWIWIDVYLGRRRQWIEKVGVEWLLNEQSSQLKSSVELFSERASKFATLASLAVLHGYDNDARMFVQEAASNLISYSDHKDMLLFDCLEIVEACHTAGVAPAKEWLLELATPIAYVRDFTDGDETGGLPEEFGEVLSKVAPELVPHYYEWLCNEEEYSDAISVFHSYIKTADLSDELNRALAKTSIDEVSLSILAERSIKGDAKAKAVLATLDGYLGSTPKVTSKTAQDQRPTSGEPESQREALPNPDGYPPNRLHDYLDEAAKGKPL